jgi:hypothetical protein
MSGHVLQPRNTMPRITEFWAALSVDSIDNNEGICAVQLSDGVWVPLLAADPARLPWIKEQAKLVKKKSGARIKIVKFSVREDIEEL